MYGKLTRIKNLLKSQRIDANLQLFLSQYLTINFIAMLLTLALHINLLAMIISDFRKRVVNAYILAVFALLGIYSVWTNEGVSLFKTRMLWNIAFLLYMFSVMVVYLWLTKRQISESIGIGDILFIFTLTPLFELREFIVFLTLAFAGTLIFHIILSKYYPTKTIPLISGVGISFIVYDIIGNYLI